MAVCTYGAIPHTTEMAPETAIPRTTETETETEKGTEPSIYINIRDFGLSTRIRSFVRVIFSICLSVYFLDVLSFHYLPTQDTIETGRQCFGEKMKKLTEYLTEMIPSIIHRVNVLKTSPERKDSPNDQDPTIVVPANKRATLLEGGNSMKIGGMWTLKHEISSPEFYELLIKTELN